MNWELLWYATLGGGVGALVVMLTFETLHVLVRRRRERQMRALVQKWQAEAKREWSDEVQGKIEAYRRAVEKEERQRRN